MRDEDWLADVESSYDTVAESYAELVRGALDGHAYLMSALSLFAEQVTACGGGLVADVGCGPGEVAARLDALGLDVLGIDLSPRMVDIARRRHPSPRFEVGSMTDMQLATGSLAGVLAWQSLIHVPDEAVPAVISGFHDAVRPGGRLQLLFHAGEGSWVKTEGYGGHPMNVRVHRRQPDEVATVLGVGGFEVEAQTVLDPGGEAPQAILSARRLP
ncbi:class I SAM-dependent DNA methyltransferase [Actinomycetospora aeridis]|uniref:Methyltransferase domain-containing protein n=1 Tax=Actinomycetospora aeridis TaxID=3129231 RepID=A0ABU8N7D6_9PSEU